MKRWITTASGIAHSVAAMATQRVAIAVCSMNPLPKLSEVADDKSSRSTNR